MDYANSLRALNSTILETRRLKFDLLDVFNIFNGLEVILPADVFVTENARSATRGQPFKIANGHSIRKYLITQRIANVWNRILEAAVMSNNINQFKGHIDKYLKPREEDDTSQHLTAFLVVSSTASTL